MNDLELMRLYLLYKAGSVQDGKKNSDLLQIAKAAGSDLSQDEFGWLSKEVERLGEIRETRAKERNESAGVSKGSDGSWNFWQKTKKFAMGSREYQQRLWELPDLVRSSTFRPMRLADGSPIDIDQKDAEGSQSRLKALPYSQVKHDAKLRDAWHAAQSGKFEGMLDGDSAPDGWDNLLPGSSLPSSSAPLRSLLQDIIAPPISADSLNASVARQSAANGGSIVAPQIDLGTTARQNAASGASSGIVENPLNLPGSGKSGGGMMDMMQTGLDAIGVMDPTPIADGLNAGISVARAFTDPANAGRHLVNAGVSAVSMIPYIGDLAKVFKYGGKGAKAAKAGEEAAQAGSQSGGIGSAIGGLLGGLGGGGSSNGGGGGFAGMFGGLFGGGGGGGSGGTPSGPASGGNAGGGSNGNILGMLAVGAIAVVAALKALDVWINRTVASGERLLDSQRDLAKYSGELSNAFAMSDTRDVLRNVREAQYLDSSAAGLAGSQSDLKDAVAFRDAPQKRFNNDFGNVMAQISTYAVYFQSFIDAKGLILRALYAIVDNTKPKDSGENSAIGELAKAIADGKFGVPQPPPPPAPPKLPAMGAAQLNRLKGWRW